MSNEGEATDSIEESINDTEPTQAGTSKIWWASLLYSAVITAMIGYIFYITYHDYTYDDNQIVSQAALDNYLSAFENFNPNFKNPVHIPTGLFIQSLQFEGPNRVHVSGYVWQDYIKGVHDNIQRGFSFPESINAKITEVYKYEKDNIETIGWYFESLILENFDCSKYPLDNKRVWLRIWPNEFNENVVLTPDFNAYKTTKKEDTFGLDPQIVLSGFNIKETFFNYETFAYNTNFGLEASHLDDKPEFYFNISLQRDFSSAFFIYIFPVLLVVLVGFTYCINMVSGQSKTSMVSMCSGLIFITVIMHVGLRRTAVSGDIVFIEYLYILVIVFASMLALNAVAISNPQSRLARMLHANYKNNVFVKALYWPVFLSAVLGIMLIVL